MIRNYDSLPLGKFVELQKAVEDSSLDELGRQVRMLSILTDKGEDELLNLPIMEYSSLASNLAFLEEEPKAGRMPKAVTIGEWECVVRCDVQKMTTAQYTDYMTFSAGGRDSIAQTLSCFLVPKGKKYNEGYDVTELQRAIWDNLPITTALALSAFFLKRSLASIRGILISLMWRTRKLPKAERKKAREMIALLLTPLVRGGVG